MAESWTSYDGRSIGEEGENRHATGERGMTITSFVRNIMSASEEEVGLPAPARQRKKQVDDSFAMPWSLPDTFQEAYELIRPLGEGGAGKVWLVKSRRVGQLYAAKFADQDPLRGQLRMEAARLKGLKNRIFPYVADFLENDVVSILVQEYIEGEGFDRYLARKAPLPEQEAAKMGKEIARILQELHQMQPKIIYQDLKPSNLILQKDGMLRLIDFGTALCGHLEIQSPYYMGTSGYSAPEQKNGGVLSERTDIYSLGALMSFMLTGVDPGRPPFLIADPLREPVPVSAGFRKLVVDCCQDDPAKRPKNTEDVVSRLSGRFFLTRAIGKILYVLLLLGYIFMELACLLPEWGWNPVLILDEVLPQDAAGMIPKIVEDGLFWDASAFVFCGWVSARLSWERRKRKNVFIRKRKVDILCCENNT